MAFCQARGLGYLPIGFFFLLLATVGFSYLIAVLNGDVAKIFPYISDTGRKPPESCVFAQFVNLSSLVLLVLMYIRYKEVDTIEGLPPQRVSCLNKAGFILGVISTTGLSIVGNFQDTNVLVVHKLGAVTLFFCATVYSMLHTRITYLLCPEYSRLLTCRVRLLLSVLMTASFVICTVCEGVATIQWTQHHNATDTPAHWRPTDGGYTFHIISASFEWALTGTFGLFCLTFYTEFRRVSLGLNMFLHVEPFPGIVTDNSAEPSEYTPLYT